MILMSVESGKALEEVSRLLVEEADYNSAVVFLRENPELACSLFSAVFNWEEIPDNLKGSIITELMREYRLGLEV